MAMYDDDDRRYEREARGPFPRMEPRYERPVDRPVERPVDRPYVDRVDRLERDERAERLERERVAERSAHRPYLSPVTSLDVDAVSNSTVKWRAIFAGLFVSLMTYLILMSAGLALGGLNLVGVIQGRDSAQALGIGAGIWMVAAIMISLFTGAFAASRVSGLITNRIGRTQGVVIAALFFGVMLSQLGSAIGTLGRGVGDTIGAVGSAAGDLSKNPQVQDLVDDVIGDLNLRSSPEVVVSGVTRRLVRGDTQSAVNYLSREANITPEEANARLQHLQGDIKATATDVGTTAAHAIKVGGLTLFGALVLGMLSSLLGGGLGAGANLRKPLSRADQVALRDLRAA